MKAEWYLHSYRASAARGALAGCHGHRNQPARLLLPEVKAAIWN